MGCQPSKEREGTVAPLEEGDGSEMQALMSQLPRELAIRLYAANTIDDVCNIVVKELANAADTSVVLRLSNFPPRTYFSTEKLEKLSLVFSNAWQLCQDSTKENKDGISRAIYAENVANDSRFKSSVPTQGQEDSESDMENSRLLAIPITYAKGKDYGALILFGSNVSEGRQEGLLMLFAAIAAIKIDSLKSALMHKDLFQYYHLATATQLESYLSWESTFATSLPTDEEIKSVKFEPHLYDINDDTLIYIFKSLYTSLFPQPSEFAMDDKNIVVFALSIRKNYREVPYHSM